MTISSATLPTTITENDIANYLLHTPDFFQRHADILARIQLTPPHGGRAISLADRQLELQRERYKTLELKLSHLLRIGKENIDLTQKLHRWMINLIVYVKKQDNAKSTDDLCSDLQTIFDIPQVIIATNEIAQHLAKRMFAPVCGAISDHFFEQDQIMSLLNTSQQVASLAVVPMEKLGILILASDDPNRFRFDMGTEFLTRVGELIHAGLYGKSDS